MKNFVVWNKLFNKANYLSKYSIRRILKVVKLLNKEMLKGITDLLILSLLNEKDSYGYEISKEIKRRTEGAFALQEPTLYLSLKRLEKRKMVSCYWGKETRGGRRKYYSITEEGRRVLRNHIRDWNRLVEIVGHFL